ncbi:MAG: SMP-30/gluconolactonase/LRE family protein, partial [Rhodobacteraceae bacterium]|nr:SMP-30/gluconolactonase/LRE family protein [Paracoccaceae bacterium]
MTVEIFDDRICQLGEGPLWHPTRKQFFWFDILGKRLMTQINGEPHHWQFDEHVSAAGWVDDDTLLIASETSLFKFNLETAESEFVVPLEVDNPATRSNDGRADPWGGFWIGTMGLEGEADAGAIYRYYQGEIRKIITPITISNSICFAPDQDVAYFADTKDKQIMKQE